MSTSTKTRGRKTRPPAAAHGGDIPVEYVDPRLGDKKRRNRLLELKRTCYAAAVELREATAFPMNGMDRQAAAVAALMEQAETELGYLIQEYNRFLEVTHGV